MENLSKEVIEKIKNNIRRCNNKDKEKLKIKGYLTFEDFQEKLEHQKNKCYVCKQEFKYDGGKWCYFFPSADRIYNYSPHSKANVAISCFFCNVRMYKQINEKKCSLCENEEHNFSGEIITKSELFKSLGNSNYKIHQYIKYTICGFPKSNMIEEDEDTEDEDYEEKKNEE
jgi:hypothetical protein